MKLIKFILFFLCFLFFACQSDRTSQTASNMDQMAKEASSPEAVQKLLYTYQEELKKVDVDEAKKAVIASKMAKLQLDNNRLPDAIQTLKTAIRNYYGAPTTSDNLWSLGEIFKNKRPIVTKTIQKLYADLFPSGKHIAAAKQLLTNDSTSLYQHLDNLGSTMYNEETHRLETNVASDFIESCDLFALLKPKDPKSADYLHKAGETARATRSFTQAINIYDCIYANYPNFEKAPQALFLKAFTYDNDLKNFDKARALYTEFLEKYPNDDFADDTQFLLNNLGKTDEEIIQGFSKEKQQ